MLFWVNNVISTAFYGFGGTSRKLSERAKGRKSPFLDQNIQINCNAFASDVRIRTFFARVRHNVRNIFPNSKESKKNLFVRRVLREKKKEYVYICTRGITRKGFP